MDINDTKAAKGIADLIIKRDIDVMSPEGVEERVVLSNSLVITLTQGGKYRTYLIAECGNKNCNKKHVKAMETLCDTEQEACNNLGMYLINEGVGILRAEVMMGTIEQFLKRRERGE